MIVEQYAQDQKIGERHLAVVRFSKGWHPGADKSVPELQEAFASIPAPMTVAEYAKLKKHSAAHRDAVCLARNWLPDSESGVPSLEAAFAAVPEPPKPDAPPAE